MCLFFYIVRLIGCFIALSRISRSTQDINSGSSLTAGPYPKDHDVVGCASEYGENLDAQACYKALQTMPDGPRFAQFVSHKSYAGQEALVTPIYYYDNNAHRSEASCVITVDLAGRSDTNNNVQIRKNTLRELVSTVNKTCIIENSGQGGFITYKLRHTISGIAKFKKVPAGYDTPLFLTVQISPNRGRARPGNTDPRVNAAVQEGLLELIPQITFRSSRAKVFTVVNGLKEVYKRMLINGTQAWWDSRNIIDSIPENVDYNCYASRRPPRSRDCEDASFQFIGEGNVIIGPRQSLAKQVGDCKIEVSSKQLHACKWDVLRATIDVLLGICLDGPQAVGLEGVALARPFDPLNARTSTHKRQSIEYQNATEIGVGPPLPPTFEIEIFKEYPIPQLSICNGSTEPVKDIHVCNNTSSNGSLWVGSQTGIVASLVPVANNAGVTS